MVLPLAPSPAFEFKLEADRGLTVESAGVPVIRGSYFQVVSPDWKRAYYSSTGGGSTVERVDADTIRLSFKGDAVEGSEIVHREGDHLKVHYEFRYSGEGDAIVELAAGLVWADAFDRGTKAAPSPTETIGGRRLGPDATTLDLKGPLGSLVAKGSMPLTGFDARRYPQPWAEGRNVLWVGDLGLPLSRGTTTADVEWTVPAGSPPIGSTTAHKLPAVEIPDAVVPDESRPLLIPKPQMDRLHYESPIEITGKWNLPIGFFDHFDDFKAALARRFTMPTLPATAKALSIDGGVSKLGLNSGGYRITIDPNKGITVVGEEDTGLRNAVEKLAQVAFVRKGHLYFPTGYLYDSPKVQWRGVHLFGGPKAREFQKRLWVRVLRPLGYDNVVLQCERTAWDATPGIATPGSMTKTQLGDLFTLYRNLGVNAVPLIQSWGHMEWLFANGKNLDLAMNPQVPYAIDPRKPRAKEVLKGIWDEAIALAKPKQIHFGLDEVTMRGWPGDDALLTDLWKDHLAFLGDLAQKHDVEPMLWGDQALFGAEAPDAALAGTATGALSRRTAIPRGAWIADWHYKDDPRPETFLKVLQLWKDARFRPIAAAWYRPDNVRGFALAAGLLDTGYLQTTWAGYESDEASMQANFRQFGAMVLGADYSWSGRTEAVAALPYDPNEVFRKLFYGRPSPISPVAGSALGTGAAFTVGDTGFRMLDLRLASVLKPVAGAESALDLTTRATGRTVVLALSTDGPGTDGDAVAEVRVERLNAPPIEERVVYGRDVRSTGDPAALTLGDRSEGGPSAFRIDLGKPGTTVTRIVVKPLNTYAGLRLMGVTVQR